MQRMPLFQRRRGALWCAVALSVAALSIIVVRQSASAHAGHDDAEIGEFDLDAPRTLTAETAKHIGLKTAEAQVQPLEDVLEISGIVKPVPDRNRAVVSRVAGKLVSVRVQVGDTVKAGDVLAVVDSPELARSIYEVRKLEVDHQKLLLDVERRESDAKRFAAEAEALKGQFDVVQNDYRRLLSVAGQGAPQRDVDNRRADVAKLEGELHSKNVEREIAASEAKALRGQAEALRLSRSAMQAIHNIEPNDSAAQAIGSAYEIRAESGGVISRRQAMPGQWVQAGENILTVADYSVVQVEGELPESLIPRVQARASSKVRVRSASSPESVLDGTVKFLAPELEPVKRTAHLIVEVPNPKGALRGEMWTTLAIVLRENKSAIAVPRSAVITMGPLHFVFLEKETGVVYQKQDINPGITNDLFVEVKDGLFPGDSVVTQGAYSLTQLRPKTAAKPAGAGHSH